MKEQIIDKAMGFQFGGMSRNELLHIYDVCYDKIVLELGSMVGMSSFVIASVCKQLHCVDVWDDEYEHLTHDKLQQDVYLSLRPSVPITKTNFLNNCNEYIEAGKIIVHQGKTQDIAKHFSNGYFDIIFIDADHSYEGVQADLNNYYDNLKDDGQMMFHDYGCGMWTGVKQACDDATFCGKLKMVSLFERVAIFEKNF